MSKYHLKNKSGFTLYELVIFIIVVGIFSIPVSLVLGQFVRSLIKTEDMHAALGLAHREMDIAKLEWYDSSPYSISTKTPYNIEGDNGINYRVSRTVSMSGTICYGRGDNNVTVAVSRMNAPTNDLVTLKLTLCNGI